MANILIAGGGIGGLAAALGIAGHGHRVTVLERRNDFTELGAGIQLGPNAFHALDLLGVGAQVRSRAVYIDELRFMDGTTGERVASMPLTGEYRARFGNPYAVVQRSDVYEPLLEGCRAHPLIQLRGTSPVVSYENGGRGPDRVSAVLASGERITGDALIGADGIRSAVRRRLVRDGEPRVSGHTIYRSVIPMELVPEELRWNTVTLWAGPKWHFVHYPIGGGAFLKPGRDPATTRRGRPSSAGRPPAHTCWTSSRSWATPPGGCWSSAGTGRPGCCATATRSTCGRTAGWLCWATPRTRCSSTRRRAPARPWRTRW
ncbi:salicylate hydroxylase [Streptomyces sp. Mg1]|nr:salicylate hydroxylase [Streptomyces sp. Mg1]